MKTLLMFLGGTAMGSGAAGLAALQPLSPGVLACGIALFILAHKEK